MNGIINVPKFLYLLELLINERFDLIIDKDITEQLKLFDIKHIRSINTDVLKNICEYKLVNDSYEDIIKRTNIDENIFLKVKKLVR